VKMSDRTTSFSAAEQHRKEDIGRVVATIDSQQEKYQGILPSDVDWNDFRNAFLVAVQMNSRLLEADRQSLFLALQRAAGDGLKPDGREGALVIFGDDDEDGAPSQARGKKKVVFMPMVWGLVKLVRNTGTVKTVRVTLIHKGEKVVVSDVNGQRSYSHTREFSEDDMVDDRPENIIAAYSVIEYKDGTWDAEFMSRRQIDRIKATSRAKKGTSPWNVWYDEQAKKTVLRRHIKRLDRSRELRRLDSALENDTTLDAEEIEHTETARVERIAQEFNAPLPDLTKRAEPVMSRSSAAAPEEENVSSAQAEAAILATDEFGEPWSDVSMTPIRFAEWFCAQLSTAKNREGLIEHNADAIADCRAVPVAFNTISAAISSTINQGV